MKKSCLAEINQPNAKKINNNINPNLFNHQEDNGRVNSTNMLIS